MRRRLNVKFRCLNEDAVVPAYAHEGDAGMDIFTDQDHVLAPHDWGVVSTGIAIALPEGYVGLVHPRSGLAAKQGVTVLNAPGTIDAGYRGEIKVILYNSSGRYVYLKKHDRIAQLIVQEYVHVDAVPVDDLDETGRGTGGFGSTGV